MKKSPLSTPSGSTQKQNYSWKVHDRKNRTGYKSDNYQCTSPNESQTNSGNDFIPLNIGTPSPERNRFNGNWRGCRGRNHRNSGSGGFNHYRNNYHSTPKSNFNNLYSPYKHSGKQFYGQKKGYQKDARKQVDISNYIDMKSFLEDPWAELTKKLNNSKEVNTEISSPYEQLLSSESIYVDSKLNSGSAAIINIDDSQFNSKSGNESSIDLALRLDDTDISSVSRTESSIDLKLENVRFSEELKNEGKCSNNRSVCEDFEEANNMRHSCGSAANVIQHLI